MLNSISGTTVSCEMKKCKFFLYLFTLIQEMDLFLAR